MAHTSQKDITARTLRRLRLQLIVGFLCLVVLQVASHIYLSHLVVEREGEVRQEVFLLKKRLLDKGINTFAEPGEQ
ncbi:MAG: hypothetical protein Q4F02_00330 [Candidatus Saccharibacteria bacterium]|nr:hypothetical protein [Candidatus Saccharibacteria bacterium]